MRPRLEPAPVLLRTCIYYSVSCQGPYRLRIATTNRRPLLFMPVASRFQVERLGLGYLGIRHFGGHAFDRSDDNGHVALDSRSQ